MGSRTRTPFLLRYFLVQEQLLQLDRLEDQIGVSDTADLLQKLAQLRNGHEVVVTVLTRLQQHRLSL